MRSNTYYIIGGAFLILVIVLQCESQKKEISNLHSKQEFEKSQYTTTINELGLVVNTQKRIITNSKSNLKEAVDKVNGLRKIQSQFKATVSAEIINVVATPIKEPEVTADTSKSTYKLNLPQSYKAHNKYYAIKYTIKEDGNSVIDTAKFILYPRFTVGYKDKGKIGNIFKKKEQVLTFETGTPYASVMDMTNISYEKPKQNIITKAAVLAAVFFIGRGTK